MPVLTEITEQTNQPVMVEPVGNVAPEDESNSMRILREAAYRGYKNGKTKVQLMEEFESVQKLKNVDRQYLADSIDRGFAQYETEIGSAGIADQQRLREINEELDEAPLPTQQVDSPYPAISNEDGSSDTTVNPRRDALMEEKHQLLHKPLDNLREYIASAESATDSTFGDDNVELHQRIRVSIVEYMKLHAPHLDPRLDEHGITILNDDGRRVRPAPSIIDGIKSDPRMAAGIAAGGYAGLKMGARAGALAGPKGAIIGGAIGTTIGGILGSVGGKHLDDNALYELMKVQVSDDHKRQQAFDNFAFDSVATVATLGAGRYVAVPLARGVKKGIKATGREAARIKHHLFGTATPEGAEAARKRINISKEELAKDVALYKKDKPDNMVYEVPGVLRLANKGLGGGKFNNYVVNKKKVRNKETGEMEYPAEVRDLKELPEAMIQMEVMSKHPAARQLIGNVSRDIAPYAESAVLQEARDRSKIAYEAVRSLETPLPNWNFDNLRHLRDNISGDYLRLGRHIDEANPSGINRQKVVDTLSPDKGVSGSGIHRDFANLLARRGGTNIGAKELIGDMRKFTITEAKRTSKEGREELKALRGIVSKVVADNYGDKFGKTLRDLDKMEDAFTVLKGNSLYTAAADPKKTTKYR